MKQMFNIAIVKLCLYLTINFVVCIFVAAYEVIHLTKRINQELSAHNYVHDQRDENMED